ncbi:MAG: thiamine diphosphokinase [Anaerolineaceae bacterium]
MTQCAYLFLNGDYADLEPLAERARLGGLVIGVDGGTQYLLSINLQPHIIIGDMDSLPQTKLRQFEEQGTTVIRHPPEKDETDSELALNYAIQHGYDSILVFGALGGRVDQTLANIFLPIQYMDKASIYLIHGTEEMFFISDHASIEGKTGDILSLIPIAGTVSGVRTTGLRYPLNGEDLLFGKTRGLSNEMRTNEARVSIESGILLCIHTPEMIVNE